MGRLDGKVAIVTGGAVGIGATYVRALAGEGAHVAIADIADGAPLAAEVGGLYRATDISDPASIEALIAAVMAEWGRIDILVNNAAVYSTLPIARYDEIDFDLWDRVMQVNIRGTFAMVRAVGPVMERQKSGKIINITSGTVYKGMPNMLHYVTSKGAITAMTRCLARELGHANICVNNLAPGLTLSDSILKNEGHIEDARDKVLASRSLKRDAYPDDLVGALIFLASGESDFMTGQTVAVDGGSINT
jgi:NAD(P)-dependent dehydrogenase (short-subunit alcohol dehydrogenase family)